MVDEESQDVASEPAAGAPVNRDRRARSRRDRRAKVASRHEAERRSKRRRKVPKPAAPPSPAAGARRASRARGLRPLAARSAAPSSLAFVGWRRLLSFAPKADLAQEERCGASAGERSRRPKAPARRGDRRSRQARRRPGGDGSAASLASIDNGALGARAARRRIGRRSARGCADCDGKAAQRHTGGEVKDLRADVDAARGEISGICGAGRETGVRRAAAERGAPTSPPSRIASTRSRLSSPRRRAKRGSRRRSRRPATTLPRSRSSPRPCAEKLAAGAPFASRASALWRASASIRRSLRR